MSSSVVQFPSIYRIVYVSTATSPLEYDELKALEQVACRNNAELGVTGILVYCDCKFMQFLEGEKSNVEEIFSVIIRDTRHYSIDVLRNGMIPRRQFTDWQMKYVDLRDIDESEGYIYNKLFGEKTSDRKVLDCASESIKLLAAFKNSCSDLN